MAPSAPPRHATPWAAGTLRTSPANVKDDEPACKRGSVHLPEGRMGDHPSQRSTLGVLRLSEACGPRAPMFDLAPGGVCQAVAITLDAGALLPHRFTLTCPRLPGSSAVCSLWHFPARHRDSRFASTLPYGAPTFLTDRCRTVRSPSRLIIHAKSGITVRRRHGSPRRSQRTVASRRGS